MLRTRCFGLCAVIVLASLGCSSSPDEVLPDAQVDNDGMAAIDATLVDASVFDAATVDATLDDAAVIDSATIDAALPDATVPDATVPDSAVVDAAVLDAAVADATVPDAAVLDAAVPDAAVPDAAVPDAAVPDAAVPDATLPPPDASICMGPDLTVLDDGSGASGATGLPDLVISEIDPGTHIELWNTTNSAITLATSNEWLCSPFSYDKLSNLAPSTTVPANGYATLPWPSSFSDTDAGGEIILYASAAFSTNTEILDFVCWGVNPHSSRKAQAEAVNKWSGACAPALTNGAIQRVTSSTGTALSDYDSTATPSPETCTVP